MQSKCRYRTRRREVRLLRMNVKKSTVKRFLLQCPLVEVIDSKPRLLTGRQSAAHWQSTLDTLRSRADEVLEGFSLFGSPISEEGRQRSVLGVAGAMNLNPGSQSTMNRAVVGDLYQSAPLVLG